MALSYLRLQGFIKQLTKYSEISNSLFGQNGQSSLASICARVISSHSNPDLDQNPVSGRPDSDPNPKIKASSRADPKPGNEKSKPQKKLHNRVLTTTEIEEERKWKQTSRLERYDKSDSFGGMWMSEPKPRPKNVVRDFNPSKLPKRISKNKNLDNLAQRIFDDNRSARNDVNTFGKLSDDNSLQPLLRDIEGEGERFLDDESDAKEGRTHIRLSKYGRFQEPHWYAKRINKLGKEGKVLEAIDLLEETMLKRDRVMPTTYVFNQLFGILGNVGYSKKAFQLFNKMKKMGVKPDGHTYTCLFNCCSNSPWSNDGLKRTQNLHQLIKDKDVALHPITFKAMVKAYGVCGDIHAAFQAADEMCKLHKPDHQLFSFLLMACVSDTKMGLKHAIQVWRLMDKMNIKPDLPLYNLLLRVIRDSGFGFHDEENINTFPQSRNRGSKEIRKEHQNRFPHSEDGETDKEFFMENVKKNHSQNSVSVEVKESNVLEVVESAASLFGAYRVNTSSIDLSYPENRLAVFGGPMSILHDMKRNNVRPNVLTFTQMFDSLPQVNEAETELLEYMRAENIPRDVDLYNNIIRRRNRRNDYYAAKEVVKYIVDDNLFLNQRTFGCLAMGCTSLPRAKILLQSINEAGLEPNVEIFGILAYKSSMDFEYKEALLGMLKKRNIYPNAKFLKNIEKSVDLARDKILRIERNEEVRDYFRSNKFKSSFEHFMINYTKWLKSIGFDEPEHPWKDFRHPKNEEETDKNDSQYVSNVKV